MQGLPESQPLPVLVSNEPWISTRAMDRLWSQAVTGAQARRLIARAVHPGD